MTYNQIFHIPHSWKDIWNEARKQCGCRYGVLSVTEEMVDDLEVMCSLIPKPKTNLFSCQIRFVFPGFIRPVIRICKTVVLDDQDSIMGILEQLKQQWARERAIMKSLGWELTKNQTALQYYYVTWERKLCDNCRVFIGRDISQSKNGYTEKHNWNNCLAKVGNTQANKLWAWRVHSPDGPVMAAVALAVNYNSSFMPSVMFRCLNKKELDMAMEHGLKNITWEKAWEQP